MGLENPRVPTYPPQSWDMSMRHTDFFFFNLSVHWKYNIHVTVPYAHLHDWSSCHTAQWAFSFWLCKKIGPADSTVLWLHTGHHCRRYVGQINTHSEKEKGTSHWWDQTWTAQQILQWFSRAGLCLLNSVLMPHHAIGWHPRCNIYSISSWWLLIILSACCSRNCC